MKKDKRAQARERYLLALAKIASCDDGKIFLAELLSRLRYSGAINPGDPEACALQNLGRSLLADLAEMDPEAAKTLHAQAMSWAQPHMGGLNG